MAQSALPFDDFRALIAQLPESDEVQAAIVRDQFRRLRPPGAALGRLEDLAAWIAAWSGRSPAVNRPLVALFAGNHGVTRHGVSSRSPDETAAAVASCAAGGAAVNQVCVVHDLGLKVFDLALHLPTGDIASEAAFDERGCAATMAFGMEATAGGADLLCVGGLGVGGSTVAAALLAAIHGGSGAEWVAEGSGEDRAMMERKVAAVDRALSLHGRHLRDPFEILRRLGGREFAAMAGAILAARMQRVPVVLDGLSAAAAASVLHAAAPGAINHCLAGHVAAGPVHARALDRLGLKPLLSLGIGSGDGTGAALAAGVVKAAAQLHAGMAAALR